MAEVKKVKPRDLVTVTGTGKSRFLAKGKEVRVHRIAAAKLEKKGFATQGKAAPEKGGKGK